MIAYAMIGSNDLSKAKDFYDALLAHLDAKRVMSTDRAHFYGNGPGNPMFGICTPYDKQDAHPGNGAMVALACVTRQQVEDVYKAALELGATCEGEPGGRGPGDALYLAYFRDADGNKIALYTPAKD